MSQTTAPAQASGTQTQDEDRLHDLVRQTFRYFEHEVNRELGLVADKTRKAWPASIAATGFGLTSYLVGVERGLMSREDALSRTLATLRFFVHSPQGSAPGATGYKGFFYHFLDFGMGQRVWECELSTIDSALFLSGALAAAQYFDRDSHQEEEVRRLADELYRRTDWRWAQNGGATVSHGWTPEAGFLPYRWEGYDEALVLYILGLGSPTYPLPSESYQAWCSTYRWMRSYGHEYLYGGPLFIHHYSHLWIDFRGIQDAFMHDHSSDYYENSRRATAVHQAYAMANPSGFIGYGEHGWGITASDGPGPVTRKLDGIERRFYGYEARGAPYGPDDGTLAPFAVVASLPFAPEIVLPSIVAMDDLKLREADSYGYKATFNPTFPDEGASKHGWISPYHFGINQGPILLAIENYRSELIWRLMRRCPYVVNGLRRAGFRGGWLEG